MSTAGRKRAGVRAGRHAPVFAALGDPTRLALVERLASRSAQSIADLAADAAITRQAITKHLTVLEEAGLVRSVRRGRERRFELCPGPLGDARRALEEIAGQWDAALARLRSFVEAGGGGAPAPPTRAGSSPRP